MNNLFKFLVFLIMISGLSVYSEPWVKVRESKGIIVWKKSSPGSSLLEFKAEGIVNSSIIKILTIIINVADYPNWVPRNQSGKLISQTDKKNMIVYESSRGSWPVDDRDFVANVNISENSASKSITILVKNIDMETSLKLVPKIKGKTRMNQVTSKWTLQAIEKDKTAVILQVFADPSGGLPKWLVNMASEDVPYDLIKNIRKQIILNPSPQLEKLNETYQEYENWN